MEIDENTSCIPTFVRTLLFEAQAQHTRTNHTTATMTTRWRRERRRRRPKRQWIVTERVREKKMPNNLFVISVRRQCAYYFMMPRVWNRMEHAFDKIGVWTRRENESCLNSNVVGVLHTQQKSQMNREKKSLLWLFWLSMMMMIFHSCHKRDRNKEWGEEEEKKPNRKKINRVTSLPVVAGGRKLICMERRFYRKMNDKFVQWVRRYGRFGSTLARLMAKLYRYQHFNRKHSIYSILYLLSTHTHTHTHSVLPAAML